MIKPPTVPRPIFELIVDVQDIVESSSERGYVSAEIAKALQPYLGNPKLLRPEECQTNPLTYHPNAVYLDPQGRFSIVSLAWLPGQETVVHDHRDLCVVGVHRGVELETRYTPADTDNGLVLVTAGTTRNEVGSVAVLTPLGDIHSVKNPGPEVAISLHIYPGDYARYGSIRRRYDLPVISK
jgi:3-mercaptopropionate dioxygenase